MNAVHPLSSPHELLSGNEAVARGAWAAGCRVAAAYPGTPSTEILEYLANYSDIYAEWSVNEKVALEVAIGASLAGSRALCAMKHVGLNVAADALMSQTLIGVGGGLVLAVADDVGLSSSQNEQDSRYWGRFAHIPILEPADAQESYEFTRYAFELSEQFNTPVLLRLTTRVCHVKSVAQTGIRIEYPVAGFHKDPARFVMTPGNAARRLPLLFKREAQLTALSETTPINRIEDGPDRRLGFITAGPTYLHVREAFPDAPLIKLGLSYPPPLEQIRVLAQQVAKLIVVEEVEPLLEQAIKAAGLSVYGKDILPRIGELAPHVLRPAIRALLGETPVNTSTNSPAATEWPPINVFPRPPTLCVACPHLGVYYCLSKLKHVQIAGDIGCYTLGAGHPWNALDTCICMGASMGVALGMDKGRGPMDQQQRILAVIGDSTFLHMGMQGLLDIVYNRGNVTVLILNNSTVGMTGGQEHAGTGRGLHGQSAPQVNFRKLVEGLGVLPERIREVDPYELPTLFKVLREEVKIDGPSVILTNQPCVLTDRYAAKPPYQVNTALCNGCSNCLAVGCPAISVTRRESVIKPNGSEKVLTFVAIDSAACTGCALCHNTCGQQAITPLLSFNRAGVCA